LDYASPQQFRYRISRLAAELELPATKRKPVAVLREIMQVDDYAANDDLYNLVVKTK